MVVSASFCIQQHVIQNPRLLIKVLTHSSDCVVNARRFEDVTLSSEGGWAIVDVVKMHGDRCRAGRHVAFQINRTNLECYSHN